MEPDCDERKRPIQFHLGKEFRDLFIESIIEEHPWFERNGMDLITFYPGFSDPL